MDWIRRNWPDVLIGAALVAVIAGIVATLLTGGSFLPVGGGDVTPASTQNASPQASVESGEPSEDASPEANEPADEGAAGNGDDGPGVAVLPPNDDASEETPASDPEAASPEAAQDEADAPEASGEQPAVEPIDPGDDGEGEAGDGEAVAAAPEADPEPAPEADPEPAAEPADGEDEGVDEGAAAELPTDPYRVSVGAFGSRENAERQAERFREDGFPVFIGSQDDLSLVLVGPYVDRGQAEGVATRIENGYDDVDPIIYLYEPGLDEEGEPASAGAAVASAEDAEGGDADEAAPAASDGADDAAGAEGPVRLQVGAYATPDSAAPQVERLEELGFDPVEERDGGLIRVMIGPLEGAALDDARTTLDGAGIEYFPR